MLTPEQIEIIKNSFKYKEDLKHKTPYRIKFDGKFLVTASNKTLWRGIGPAKLAIMS